ncbi:MAG TPA: ubiquitin-like domain-containing protein, partial [Anaerolineales bacterium]|nr:ubiquitin-like domain-containing protein [Anaerolineales bacterium]
MRSLRWLAFAGTLFLFACQTQTHTITILDGETTLTVTTSERVPLRVLGEAGITTQPMDRVLVNGLPYQLDEEFTGNGAVQMQLRRTANVKLITPQGEQTLQTSAWTVGEALKEMGLTIGIRDQVTPPLSSPITDALNIILSPARNLVITTNGKTIRIRSAAGTVGEALAEAGMPLLGLDVSFPAENEALPADGQIRVLHVTEAVSVAVESIPFETQETESVDVPFGQQDILTNGINGLAMTRTRIRYEDGIEVSRSDEGRTVLREPVMQVVANGTKIVLSPVGGDAPYKYWYATKMYASWYSPCNSGTGGCSYGTASGARAGYGVVAVDYSYYPYLAGMKVYI